MGAKLYMAGRKVQEGVAEISGKGPMASFYKGTPTGSILRVFCKQSTTTLMKIVMAVMPRG